MPHRSLRYPGIVQPIDLGFESPLSTEGAAAETLARGRINYRWLAGIILAGVSGTGLMILAVAGALDPGRHAPLSPQMSRAKDERGSSGTITTARRSDKLIQKINLVAARQDYKAPINVKSAGAEVTRQIGLTRLATPLALESLGYADAIPAFNLAKLVTIASEDRTAPEQEAGGVLDPEIGLTTRPIAATKDQADSGISLNDSDAQSQVIDALSDLRRTPTPNAAQSSLARVMRAPTEGQTLMAFTTGVSDPFSKLVVKMVPENVTVLPRRDAVLAPLLVEERIVVSRNLEATNQVLKSVNATPKQIKEIIAALTRNGRAANLDGNRILKLSLQPSEPDGPKELMRVELYADETLVASTGRRDDGTFWPIEARDIPEQKPAPAAGGEEEEEADSTRLTLYASIHETARRHDIAPAVIEEIIRTVFFDVDLQRRVAPGDSLEILIANGEAEAQRHELLLVSLNAAGAKRRYYRFKLPEDEIVDYFDDQGRSVKQFLLRKPLDGGQMRSGYGNRRHPILGYYRLHSGVDWSDRVGTPIRAAGNGIVRLAEWDSGYGRRVEIEHNHGYVTTYSHLSAFGPGIRAGSRVRQGEIIGRLGSSGLSTGPHLHYEVMINDRFVDPIAIKLPKGRELAGTRLAEFKRERDRVEDLLTRAPGRIASIAQK